MVYLTFCKTMKHCYIVITILSCDKICHSIILVSIEEKYDLMGVVCQKYFIF